MEKSRVKRCGHCKQQKNKSEFHKDCTRKDGLYNRCKDCVKLKHQAATSKYYKRNKKKVNAASKKYRDKVKMEVLNAYGGPRCVCCGETIVEFLSVDHINGNGTQHLKQIAALGNMFYGWLRKNNFPPGYQILCRNCNWGKYVYGVCPHKDIYDGT